MTKTSIVGLCAAVLVAGCGNSTTADTGTGDTPPARTLNNCTDGMYTDGTAASAGRVISFSAMMYSPPCLLISAGQTVTFSGSFSAHPLMPGLAPNHTSDPAASAGNPIVSTSTGSTAMFTFPTAGTYPFYCINHFGGGMMGSVQVQ